MQYRSLNTDDMYPNSTGNSTTRSRNLYPKEEINEVDELRSLLTDKENIIRNLMLRLDVDEILAKDSTFDKTNESELCRKAETMAQRAILENFELRELISELRDENFSLRNEIYDMQDD